MSTSDEARDVLKERVRGAYSPAVTAGIALAATTKSAVAQDDLEATMGCIVEAIVAGEQLVESAKAFVSAAREALATCINDTGAPDVVTMHHKAFMARKTAWVSVDDPSALPEEYWRRAPDKDAIKAVLKNGVEVPGCTMVQPQSMTLKIANRK